ncbi:MAG: TA system VapC family ribonuclease toxin [Pseudomonadota bacterium]
MSTTLLDVNVLLALSWAEHQFHAAAQGWFLSPQRQGWASCAMTECGFIRISSNKKITLGGGTVRIAHQTLTQLRHTNGHVFWPDDFSPTDEPLFAKLQGHNQVTDAYLLLLAHRRKGKLATFDAGIKALARDLLGDDKRVLLIPHQI